MKSKVQSTWEKKPAAENPYFEVQASWGMTRHMGGLKATKKLAELCHIHQDKYILVVGCGVGVTPCYIAKKYGCKVMGIDLSDGMIVRAKERALREKVKSKIEFRVADAQDLPFAENTFDAVITESVNAFVENKARAMSEYVRVLKPEGYCGINEVTWLETPPQDLESYLFRIMNARFLARDGWKRLLDNAGLRETQALVYKTNIVNQWTEEVKQFQFSDFIKAWSRYAYMFISNPAARKFTGEALAFPWSMLNLLRYFGYGLYTGRR